MCGNLPSGSKPKGYYVLMRETTSAFWQKKFFTTSTEMLLLYSKDNYFLLFNQSMIQAMKKPAGGAGRFAISLVSDTLECRTPKPQQKPHSSNEGGLLKLILTPHAMIL